MANEYKSFRYEMVNLYNKYAVYGSKDVRIENICLNLLGIIDKMGRVEFASGGLKIKH